MNNLNPIGFFDSGIGGTSIWKEVHQLLPYENTIYLADSKNAPYGVKSKNEIIELCIKNTELLLNKNCKLIVVACNTATTNAISYLRENYQVPFIGIEPAIKPAAQNSETQTIGVLATKGTINSELFHKSIDKYPNIKFIEQIGYGLVPLIENGEINSNAVFQLLKEFIEPMVQEGIDYLVLGCTHYPYLIPQIKKIVPSHVKIIDSGEAVAKQTKYVLEENKLSNNIDNIATSEFYININPKVLQSFVDPKKVFYLDF